MTHTFALLSIVFMMSFVALFDSMHVDGCNDKFCRHGLMSPDDITRLMTIFSACQD